MRRVSTPSRPSKTLKVFGWLLAILLLAAFAWLLVQALSIQIFSSTQLMIAGGVMALIILLLIWAMLRNAKHKGWRIFAMIVSFCLAAGMATGGWYLSETSEFFSIIGGGFGSDSDDGDDSETNAILNDAEVLTSKMAMTVTTYAMTESNIEKPSQLSGKTIGLVTVQDEEGTEGALKQLEKEGMKNAEEKEYPDAYSLVDALYAHEVDAIVLPEQFHGDLLDAANDDNKYNALTTFTRTVDQYIYYEPVPEEMKNPADRVKNITKDPFIVLISGSDSYGNLATKSRSDVNMLVAVNPETSQVLLVSLPRDSYMEFSCKKNETACGPAAGQMDKLTHSGIYGIGTTESSIEDFMDIEINYTVRVNFSSLINVVDSIGGIDVNVEEGLEVDRFYSNGTEGVHAGINHLDGERALAFARERHAYIDGDNQRVKNQQIVMKSLLKAMMSPTMIVKYPSFIRALSTAFSTNMPSSQIRDLIRLEVSSFPAWNIQSYALSGSSATRYCAALNREASVSLVDESDLEQAKELIDKVTDGKSVKVPEETKKKTSSQESSDSSMSTDSSGFDESYDQIPIEQLPGYYDPYQSAPSYTEPSYSAPVYTQPDYSTPDYPTEPLPEQTPPDQGGTFLPADDVQTPTEDGGGSDPAGSNPEGQFQENTLPDDE